MNTGSLAERDVHKASKACSPPLVYALDIECFISVLDGIVICNQLDTNPYTTHFSLRSIYKSRSILDESRTSMDEVDRHTDICLTSTHDTQ